MSFPEEQLDSPVGYYPAEIGQRVHYGEWHIVRKLGWGPRSSTWLALHSKEKDLCVALKIFTTAATEDGSALNEQRFLYMVRDLQTNVPRLRHHFTEQSARGGHLCLELHSLTSSVETLRLSNTEEGEYLPLHIVQTIMPDILNVMGGLARKKIIHGAVLPDNFLFWGIQAPQNVIPELERSPCHEMVEVTGSDGEVYLTVKSQPMPLYFKWNNTRDDFEEPEVFLSNFSHARLVSEPSPFKSPANFLPPEVLLGGKLDCSVDMFMLGCSAYLMATGTPLFSDSYVASPLEVLEKTLPKLEELLNQNGKVSRKNIAVFSKFLRACLASNPAKRATVKEQFQTKWITPLDMFEFYEL